MLSGQRIDENALVNRLTDTRVVQPYIRRNELNTAKNLSISQLSATFSKQPSSQINCLSLQQVILITVEQAQYLSKNGGYNANGIRDFKKLLEIIQERQISITERFCVEMRSTFGNTCMCGSTYTFYEEASKIYSKNRNRRNIRRQPPICCHQHWYC